MTNKSSALLPVGSSDLKCQDKPAITPRIAAVVATCLIATYLAMIFLLRDDKPALAFFSDLFFPVINILSTGGLLYATVASEPGSRARKAWGLLAASQLSFTIGDIYYAFLEIGLHQSPFPSAADIFYLACYPLFAMGVLLFPVKPLSSIERIKLALDEGIIIISALIFSFVLFIGPRIAENNEDILSIVISVAYYVMDLMLLFALLDLIFRRRTTLLQVPLAFLASGTAVEILTDSIFAIKTLDGTYYSGDLMVDPGWALSYCLIGLAGVYQATSGRDVPKASLGRGIQIGGLSWQIYLPYLWAGAAFILMAWSQSHPISFPSSYLTWGVGLVIALIFIRQIIMLSENKRLFAVSQKEIEVRKLAEKSLSQSENMYRAIFENTGTAMFIVEDDSTISLTNSEGERLSGQSKLDLKGESWMKYVAEGDLEKIKSHYDLRMTGQNSAPSSYEFTLKHVSGGPKYMHLTVAMIPGTKKCVASVQDITERRMAEEALLSRDRILEAVSFAAEQFLKADSWEDIIYDVLGRLGLAAGVSRAFIFDGRIDDDGQIQISLRYEWTMPGIRPHDRSIFEGFYPRRWGFTRWEEALIRGDTFYGRVRDFPLIERTLLATQDVKSILVLPIAVGHETWGIMGFDDCIVERKWSVADIESLKAAVSIVGDAIQRKQAAMAQKESEERFRRLAENSPDIITRTEIFPRPHLTYISPAVENVLGYKPLEICSNPGMLLELVHPDDRHLMESFDRGEVQPGTSIIVRWLRRDGTYVWAEQRSVPIYDKHKNLVAVEGFARDITDRMDAMEKIRAALKEKEVMLKEIHHRVKNNLQIISSLLSLQSNYVKDQAALEMLRESQNRVRSMALVHDRLYRSPDLAGIDFTEYVKNLASGLARSYKIKGWVALRTDVEDIFLSVDQAIPCGLIINELITNSMKHAFNGRESGEIYVKVSRMPSGKLLLIAGDDGIGLPEDIDFRKTRSIGLTLVVSLVKQLKGTIEVCRERGTEFRIVF